MWDRLDSRHPHIERFWPNSFGPISDTYIVVSGALGLTLCETLDVGLGRNLARNRDFDFRPGAKAAPNPTLRADVLRALANPDEFPMDIPPGRLGHPCRGDYRGSRRAVDGTLEVRLCHGLLHFDVGRRSKASAGNHSAFPPGLEHTPDFGVEQLQKRTHNHKALLKRYKSQGFGPGFV